MNINWDLLDKIGILIGIFSFFPVLIAMYITIKVKWQEMKMRNDLRQNAKGRSVILIIDVMDGSIKSQVLLWVKKSQVLSNIKQSNIYSVDKNYKNIKPKDIDDIMSEVRLVKKKIQAKGVEKIHLFYRGPGILAIKIGSEFSNGCSVLCYQLDNYTKTYQCWGRL